MHLKAEYLQRYASIFNFIGPCNMFVFFHFMHHFSLKSEAIFLYLWIRFVLISSLAISTHIFFLFHLLHHFCFSSADIQGHKTSQRSLFSSFQQDFGEYLDEIGNYIFVVLKYVIHYGVKSVGKKTFKMYC